MANVATWDFLALILRCLGLVVFVYLTIAQFQEMQAKALLRPLARLLFFAFALTIVVSMPALYVTYQRAEGISPSNASTTISLLASSVGFLIISILVFLIYRYDGE